MKKCISILLFFTLCIIANAQTDSTATRTLGEVVVNAKGQIETAEKAVLTPTTLEKRHATNGFELLNVMQTPELDVSPRTNSISTKGGGQVVLCINGMEVQPEDVSTLRASNIISIEYIRTPSGKYAGKAALLNFIIKQMSYGGNVYLSASEGFAYKNGDYLAFTDFTKKQLTLSVAVSADWKHDHSHIEGHDLFRFADNSTLANSYSTDHSLRKQNSQSARFRLSHTGNKHQFVSYLNLTRQAEPSVETITNNQYTGKYNLATTRTTTTNGKSLAPTLYANYVVWLPHKQTIDVSGSFAWGNNSYNSTNNETAQANITSKAVERNIAVNTSAQYSKSLNGSTTLSASLWHNHNYYKDTYTGTTEGQQRLTTNQTGALAQLSGSGQKHSYYISAGLSNTAVSLNKQHYNYCVPMAFYGGNYAFNDRQALSLNGYLTHTMFDPSNKNDMTVPTSFFQAVKGNPDLALIKVFGNTLTYNAQWGKSKASIFYNSNIYFKNIAHLFTADASTIFDMRVNDGTFYGNMLGVSYALSAFADKLRLDVTALEEYNVMRGDTYNMQRNVFRLRTSLAYLVSDWMFSLLYQTPRTDLDIREPFLIRTQPIYEMAINWNHKAWAVEFALCNVFSRYAKQHITMDYGHYNRDSWHYNEPNGRVFNLKITYSIGYGKTKQRGEMELNKNINSAIIKGF